MYCNVLIQKAVNIRDNAISHSDPRVIVITGAEKEVNEWAYGTCVVTALGYMYTHPVYIYTGQLS